MTEQAATAQHTAPGGDVVEVRIPATVVYVATLRLTAASLAARCDLTIDDIEDLRLAVDEACALLLPQAADGAHLAVRFQLDTGRLSVAATVATDGTTELDRDGFAWTVLDALANSVEVDQDATQITISITKSREAQSA